jgi:nitrogen regulatory protein P-II 1
MVLIEAFIKPFKLDDLKDALDELGTGGITVTEVMQQTESRSRGRSFNALGPAADLMPKIKVEIAAPRQMCQRIIEAICLHGSSGKTEDGRIVVRLIQAAVRIRTGERDHDAVSL